MAITFHRTKIGGGGYVIDIEMSSDGLTFIHRTDVFGCYIWDASADKWQQLFTDESLPAADRVLGSWGEAYGCYALRVAPSNSSILYTVLHATTGAPDTTTVYKSTDRGTTWATTNLTPMLMSMQSNYRSLGPKMAIHPTNPDIVLVFNSTGQLYRTANGGTSWSLITTPEPGEGAIVFDPTDGSKVYIGWALGTDRVYRSTDAGATFSQLTGGPDTVGRITCSADGTVFIATSAGLVWKLSGTTFTDLTSAINQDLGGWHAIACDPNDANTVSITSAGGGLNTSFDAGATWIGAYDNAGIRESSDDIQWLEWTLENYMASGCACYDPIVADKLWIGEGIGVWYTTPPTGAYVRPTWYSQTRGNDELIVNDAIYPPSGYPILAVQDRALFTLADTSVYPSTHGPAAGVGSTQIQHAWGIDYASSDPSFIAAKVSGGFGSCYSTDKGLTWTAFSSQDCGSDGSIAALTPLNMVSIAINGAPKYTTDGGATWTTSTIEGTPDVGYGYSPYLNLRYVAADRVASNFYIVNYNTPKACYKSTDGGANFTKVCEDVVVAIGVSARLQTVPGQSGHLFFTGGTTGAPHPNNLGLKRSTDAGTTWSSVSGVTECWALGFGKEAPGESYPAIMMVGVTNGDTLPGIYISTDNCTNWTLLTRAPAHSLDVPRAVAGDMSTYGKFHIGLSGSGGVYSLNGFSAKTFGLQF